MFQQFKQGSIHVESLRGLGPKALKVKDGGAQEGNLHERQHGIPFNIGEMMLLFQREF